MVTNSLYPHILQTKSPDGLIWVDLSVCEEQPNTKGRLTAIADRSDYLFTSLVFIPKQDITIKPGQNLRILTGDRSEVTIEGTAARFSKNGFKFRVWI